MTQSRKNTTVIGKFRPWLLLPLVSEVAVTSATSEATSSAEARPMEEKTRSPRAQQAAITFITKDVVTLNEVENTG
jgi:hypothetical protein